MGGFSQPGCYQPLFVVSLAHYLNVIWSWVIVRFAEKVPTDKDHVLIFFHPSASSSPPPKEKNVWVLSLVGRSLLFSTAKALRFFLSSKFNYPSLFHNLDYATYSCISFSCFNIRQVIGVSSKRLQSPNFATLNIPLNVIHFNTMLSVLLQTS